MVGFASNNVDPLLGAPATMVSCAEAEAVLREHFNLAAQATALSSERDGNFRMRASDGADYLLKFASSAEAPSVTNLQTAALRHLECRAPQLPVPRLIAARNGEDEVVVALSGGRRHIVRLMTFLPGDALAASSEQGAFRPLLAPLLAQLALALEDFQHPSAEHDLLWDASKALRVRPLVGSIADADRRAFAARMLDEYEAHTAPQLPHLRAQAIHNDFNPHNILVAADGGGTITGIIDFGDLIRAPLISDLATAIAYLPLDGSDPLDLLTDFTARYHAVLPLMDDELDFLLDLVRARQVMIVAVTEWRAARHPHNRAYILRNNPRAWKSLSALGRLARQDVRDALQRACGKEKLP